MKKVLLFGLFALLIFSCNPINHGNVIAKTNDSNLIDTILFQDSRYLLFENLSDSTYRLIWGNKTIRNKSNDTIHILPSGKLNLSWVSNNAIGLRQGCGSSCFFTYVLPLVQNAEEKFYMYPLAFDTINNIIAYGNDRNDYFLTIENYISGKTIKLNNDYLKGPFTGYCVDSISFQPKGLYLKWKDSKEKIVSNLFNVDELNN